MSNVTTIREHVWMIIILYMHGSPLYLPYLFFLMFSVGIRDTHTTWAELEPVSGHGESSLTCASQTKKGGRKGWGTSLAFGCVGGPRIDTQPIHTYIHYPFHSQQLVAVGGCGGCQIRFMNQGLHVRRNRMDSLSPLSRSHGNGGHYK